MVLRLLRFTVPTCIDEMLCDEDDASQGGPVGVRDVAVHLKMSHPNSPQGFQMWMRAASLPAAAHAAQRCPFQCTCSDDQVTLQGRLLAQRQLEVIELLRVSAVARETRCC